MRPSPPNNKMIDVLRGADIALFPNRAEGGTNLVAMECLTCGLPVVLSKNTGHLDLINSVECFALENQFPVQPLNREDGTEGWGESDMDEIIEALEHAYQNRDETKEMGLRASDQMREWSWGKKVDILYNEVKSVYEEAN